MVIIGIFFIVSKTLNFLLSPLLWVFLLLTLGCLRFALKKDARLIYFGVICFWLIGNDTISSTIMRAYSEDPVPIKTLTHYRYGIVLGGFTDLLRNPKDRIYTGAGTDRILQAIQLYRIKKIEKLFLTGGSGTVVKTTTSEAKTIAKICQLSNIQPSDIITEDSSRTTAENATLSMKKIRMQVFDANKDTILLITSAWHCKRAILAFKKAGFNVKAYPVDFRDNNDDISINSLFVPNSESFTRYELLLHEWLGYIIYRF